MIVYVKSAVGKIYASPVFAEIGKGWDVKSVVLNEKCDRLVLLPYLKDANKLSEFNYFYIDKTLQEGWSKKEEIRGFAEIIENSKNLKALENGNSLPLKRFECVKLYSMPLPVVTEFTINTEQDIEQFNTICNGLHDAYIERVDKNGDEVTINFDTTWSKHIVITFSGVSEMKFLESIECILNSEFIIRGDQVLWSVTNMVPKYDDQSEEIPYILSTAVTWNLLID